MSRQEGLLNIAGRKDGGSLFYQAGLTMLDKVDYLGDHVIQITTDLFFRCRGQGLTEQTFSFTAAG